jgi:hypothetical protein
LKGISELAITNIESFFVFWKFSVPPLASVPPEYNFVISFKAAASSAALGLKGKIQYLSFCLVQL